MTDVLRLVDHPLVATLGWEAAESITSAHEQNRVCTALVRANP